MGVHGGTGLKYLVAAVIMVVQLGLALYGFYAIRSFEKYTVPVTVLLMAVMTVLAHAQADVQWTACDRRHAGGEAHGRHAAADRDRDRLGRQLGAVLRRLQPFRAACRERALGVLGVGVGHVRPHRVAGRARRLLGERGQADSFAQAFDHWIMSILIWISPWAAIVLVDFFWSAAAVSTSPGCTPTPTTLRSARRTGAGSSASASACSQGGAGSTAWSP
jgi:hypothetical protein